MLDTFIGKVLHLRGNLPNSELISPILQFTPQQSILIYKISIENTGLFRAIVCLNETNGWQESKLYFLGQRIDFYFKQDEDRKIVLCLEGAQVPRYISDVLEKNSLPKKALFEEVSAEQAVAELSLGETTVTKSRSPLYSSGGS